MAATEARFAMRVKLTNRPVQPLTSFRTGSQQILHVAERTAYTGMVVPMVLGKLLSPKERKVQAAAFIFRRDAPPPPDPESPEQVALRNSAGWQRSLSFVAFWLQLALTLVSAGILLFSVAASSAPTGPAWPRYFTAAGITCAFVSTFFAHGFKRLAGKLAAGEVVAGSWLASNLLGCNALNVVGIAVTVIGLQASVGTLVAKSLMTSVQGTFTSTTAANALVSLDVFSLQAATNTLLSHVVSLVATNLMLRVTSAARAAAPYAAVAVGSDGVSPVRPPTLGYSPWTLKAD